MPWIEFGGSHGEGQRRNIRKRQGWAYNNIYIRDDTVRGLFCSSFPPFTVSSPIGRRRRRRRRWGDRRCTVAISGGESGWLFGVLVRFCGSWFEIGVLVSWFDVVFLIYAVSVIFCCLMRKVWFLRFVCLILVFSAPIGRQSSWNLFKRLWRRHLLSLL